MEPLYLSAHRNGVLEQRIEAALAITESCQLCPRGCAVDRLQGETGLCQTGRQAVVSSYSPHFGEEDPLVGSNGSGTIFMTHCSLRCVFCQRILIPDKRMGVEQPLWRKISSQDHLRRAL